MTHLDAFLQLGEDVHLGAYLFDAEKIKAFARKYDPQPFHIDEEAARNSVFGRLCASGWHTASVWMKLNLAHGVEGPWHGDSPAPAFGPSPGLRHMKWPKPVYAGETVRFSRRALSHRPLSSRPGWRVVTQWSEAFDSAGDKVLEFEGAVLVNAD
ncbi:MAG: MaoC family dehydratase [Rhizobiaceae bacterium]|nr:MaoC family dehydratase [Rhizobiaceae bacterium]